MYSLSHCVSLILPVFDWIEPHIAPGALVRILLAVISEAMFVANASTGFFLNNKASDQGQVFQK